MAVEVIMPRQGQSVESCLITKWHKQVGDSVKQGDLLFSYETDKAAFDEEAPADGVLLQVLFDEDDDVPVLEAVAIIGAEGEKVEAPAEKTEDAPAEAPVEEEPKPELAASAPASVSPGQTGSAKISPRARRAAKEQRVDYSMASPTGPSGRIIERDILELAKTGPKMTAAAYAQSGDNAGLASDVEGTGIGGRITAKDLAEKDVVAHAQPDQGYKEIELSKMRQIISKAMHKSLASTAQLTMDTSFDASAILQFRQQVKEHGSMLGLENITLNDVIIFAVARTLKKHPDLNGHLLEDKMLQFERVNMGIAVDTERGLLVPTLFSADVKSLNQIAAESKRLAEESKKGSINPDLLTGGSFTITNLGTLGIESFTPVLNAPQIAILGVNTIVQRAKQVNGQIQHYPAMGLSLTFDHRAVDGAPAARFLQELVHNLENFQLCLAR